MSGGDDSPPAPVRGTDGKTYQPTQPARPSIVPEVVDEEPVEVLTFDEWDAHQEPTPDLDDLIPAEMRFQRKFWKRMVATHDLLADLDYPQYFNDEMADSLTEFAASINRKLAEFNKSRRTLRAIPGGKNA